MKNSGNESVRRRAIQLLPRSSATLLLLLTFAISNYASAQTVRDNFSSVSYGNNNGTANWSGNWIEVDGNGAGPATGNVHITGGGELSLDDQPNTNGQPSLARQANLLGAVLATLNFNWRTTNGVDNNDSLVVEVSANGGLTWTPLENFTGINGISSGSRSYNITGFATANTRIRFRVNNGYGGGNENFLVDFVEIAFTIVFSGSDLSVVQSDTPDPVNVVNPLSYTLLVANAGPDNATGVTVVDVLPVGTVFQSASASQGSCSYAAGTVTCALGALAAAGNATINIALTAPNVTGTIINSATVSGNETDPLLFNNTAAELTTVQNLNVNQMCYLVADSGGGGGGNDLFTVVDTADFSPATNETNIGIGTGTNAIEAIAYHPPTGNVYAANAGQLGTLNLSTGVFQALPQAFGTGSGSAGNVTFSDVDGLAYDATSGVMYGAHRRGGNDVLIQINPTTGAHVPNAFGANVDYVEIQAIAGANLVDDIAVDPTTGVMYATTNNGGGTDRLVTVNKLTGATTNVALITVPDIEGLGTDSTGQLWGTSGTQGMLYEIDKATGIGSNGRTIDNGGDYEAIDCYAFSPTITADLALSKIVDDASPAEGATVNYTVSVLNSGPGAATVVQLMDLLPAGVTFISATPAQGTYDALSGDWFVGNLSAGASANLILRVSVDAGTGGTTITNTVTVDFLSQVDPNVGNDIASAAINPAGSPSLLILKSASVIEDPFNGSSNPKAVPGATVRYLIGTSNSGPGAVDNDSLVITDVIPANTALRVLDFDVATLGPVLMVDGSPSTGLSYSFVSLADAADDVSFSNDGGTTFNYTPVAGANGTDPAVTHIRINPKGALAGNSGSGDPSFQVFFKTIIR